MYLLGIHNGLHDASACLFRNYRLLAAVSLERLSRRKNSGVSPQVEIPLAAIDECLRCAGIRRADVDVVCASRAVWELQSYRLRGRWLIKQQYYRWRGERRLEMMMDMQRKQGAMDAAVIFNAEAFRARYGFPKAAIYVYNHHAAHGISAYFFSEFTDALIYTADGIGDNRSYSARAARAGLIELLSGGEENLLVRYDVNSVGLLYAYFTDALGFIWNRHKGKVTGLAGFGSPVLAGEIISHFSVDERGEIACDFPSYEEMRRYAQDVCRRLSREDAAASVQEATERLICKAVEHLQRLTGLRSVAMGGGVFANVRLNRSILEATSAKRIFVFPAMGDDGLPVGGCLLYLLERDGAERWHANRYVLRDLYLGRDYGRSFAAVAESQPQVVRSSGNAVERAADSLIRGNIVAIYAGRMEFGPRALGARSILASPVRREVNEALNKRLERSEFMPFAPVVLADHASDVFDINEGNAHAARFMTITCDVRKPWRDRIPAVVHIDGSARPQIIERADNSLYYDVLERFYNQTGLPVLVNTSFNVHEEPIVDAPIQALKALTDRRIDSILTEDAIYSLAQ
jgi:carbamoyltransferase